MNLQLQHPGSMASALCEDDNLYDDFNIDDMDLELENYKEVFSFAFNNSEEFFEKGGIDSLFERKDMSASAGDSNCWGAIAASSDSMLSTKTEPIIYYTETQSHSNVSFSGVINGASASDNQECGGASSKPLTGEPPWCPPCPENSIQSANRSNAVLRYKEKKKNRK